MAPSDQQEPDGCSAVAEHTSLSNRDDWKGAESNGNTGMIYAGKMAKCPHSIKEAG